ncbi:universal stress protein [Actinokineospora auranticolor]|uniref:Nucleotide-binding universal stress UspA family protein n=1 Tax=Actinokineospora auranticolor TaxID=155976 RepID=A0A2S6GPY5_9PSEU|nr:universal stress protein [Actinokineospora auranticolor]PPK67230.1 nucleotide-binding universal stress UspA family protein [Actinokineospora auranticolor]
MNAPMPTRSPVVVAVDGSPSSADAVAWAAAEAGRHGLPLRLVHVCVPPAVTDPVGRDIWLDPLSSQGGHLLAEADDLAQRVHPGLRTCSELRHGFAAAQLLDAAADAAVLVTGHRGLGGFEGLLLGSVSGAVAAHARCPVVVVRGEAVTGGPVVVGVDGSPAGDAAIEFAFEQASTRGTGLLAVHAWSDVAYAGAWIPVPFVADWDALARDEERLLAERLAGMGEKYPEVVVERAVVRDRAARVLGSRSAGAQLVVLGAHGRHLLTGLGMGSTTRALLHHSRCPVAVVRT